MRHPSAKQRILYVHMHPLFTADQSLLITLNLIDCEDEEACRPLSFRGFLGCTPQEGKLSAIFSI